MWPSTISPSPISPTRFAALGLITAISTGIFPHSSAPASCRVATCPQTFSCSGPLRGGGSTASPDNSLRARTTSRRSRSRLAGDSPAVRTAESPAPTPSTARPRLSMFSDTIALAVTVTCRVTRFVTPGASRTRAVACAQHARQTYTSFHNICESPTYTVSKPRRSAHCASRTTGSTPTPEYGQIITLNRIPDRPSSRRRAPVQAADSGVSLARGGLPALRRRAVVRSSTASVTGSMTTP